MMTYEQAVMDLDKMIVKNYCGIHVMDWNETIKYLMKNFDLKKEA